MAVGSILKCNNCGQTYDSVVGHYTCDSWLVQTYKVSQFIDAEGYGVKTKYFDRDDVINLIINYNARQKEQNKS